MGREAQALSQSSPQANPGVTPNPLLSPQIKRNKRETWKERLLDSNKQL